ncbi:MAG: DivIVA domain-containing protein [Selenomonadaceae bacterium]|nr:DivIVA domain-containing protein [Selenomonadaceae bacterium]
MLTPMDIHNHQFKKSMVRGYNENEVDDFLDRIVVDFEKLLRDNERLKNQINTLEVEMEKYRKLEKTMNDTLLVAQKTADEVISNARKNADEMKENTARECQNIREQARLEAQQQIELAIVKRDAILEDYSKIVSEKNSFLLKIRTALESELAITNQNLNEIPKVPEKKSEPKEKVVPVETPKPVKEIVKEVVREVVKPVEKPKPIEKPKPEKVPVTIEDEEPNLVDVSTKPTEKKTVISDGTKVYNFKSSVLDEGAAM